MDGQSPDDPSFQADHHYLQLRFESGVPGSQIRSDSTLSGSLGLQTSTTHHYPDPPPRISLPAMSMNSTIPVTGTTEMMQEYTPPRHHTISDSHLIERTLSIQSVHYVNKFLGADLLGSLQKLLREEKYCDTILSLGDKHIKVHGLVLSTVTPYFQGSRSSGFCVDLPLDLDIECLKSFVSYIYTGDISLSVSNLRDVNRLANMFDIKFLRGCCERFAIETKLESELFCETKDEFRVRDADFTRGPKFDKCTDVGNLRQVEDKLTETDRLDFREDREIKMSGNDENGDADRENRKIFSELKRGCDVHNAINTHLQVEAAVKSLPAVSTHRYGTRASSVNKDSVKKPTKGMANKRNETPRKGRGQTNRTVTALLSANINRSENTHQSAGMSSLITVSKSIGDVTLSSSITSNVLSNCAVNSNTSVDDTSVNKVGLADSMTPQTPISQAVTAGSEDVAASVIAYLASVDGTNASTSKWTVSQPQATSTPVQSSVTQNSSINRLANSGKNEGVTTEVEAEAEDKVYEGQHPKQRYKMSMEADQNYSKPPKKRMRFELMESSQPTPNLPEQQPPDPGGDRSVVNPPNNDPTRDPVEEEVRKVVGYIMADKKEEQEMKSPRRKPRRNSKKSGLENIVTTLEQRAAHIAASERQYKCGLCENEFVFPKRCATHMLNNHKMIEEEIIDNIIVRAKEVGPKTCDICGYETKDSNYYYMHYHKYFRHGVPLPKGWQVYRCDICEKECFTKFQLKDHKLIHVEDYPFMCELCGNGFRSRTCLNSHVFHRHSTVRKHSCTECTKTFKTKTQLLVHSRTHSGEKPYRCVECPYESTTRGNMRLHLSNRHKFTSEHITEIMTKIKKSAEEMEEDAANRKRAASENLNKGSQTIVHKATSLLPATVHAVNEGMSIPFAVQKVSDHNSAAIGLEQAMSIALGNDDSTNRITLANVDPSQLNNNIELMNAPMEVKFTNIPDNFTSQMSTINIQCANGQQINALSNPTFVIANPQSIGGDTTGLHTATINSDSGPIAIQMAVVDPNNLDSAGQVMNVEQYASLHGLADNGGQMQAVLENSGLIQQLQQLAQQQSQNSTASDGVSQNPQVQIIQLQAAQPVPEINMYRPPGEVEHEDEPKQIPEYTYRTISDNEDTKNISEFNVFRSAGNTDTDDLSSQIQHVRVVSPNVQTSPGGNSLIQSSKVSKEVPVPIGAFTNTAEIGKFTPLSNVLPESVTDDNQAPDTSGNADAESFENVENIPADQYETNMMQQAYYHAFYPQGFQ